MLLEIVVGLGVFAAALLFIMGIFTVSHQATTSTKNLALASELARETMEQQLGRSYSGVTNVDPVEVPIPSVINGENLVTVFTSRVQVFPEAAGPAPNNFARKRVLVTVSWREGMNSHRETALETYVVR